MAALSEAAEELFLRSLLFAFAFGKFPGGLLCFAPKQDKISTENAPILRQAGKGIWIPFPTACRGGAGEFFMAADFKRPDGAAMARILEREPDSPAGALSLIHIFPDRRKAFNPRVWPQS